MPDAANVKSIDAVNRFQAAVLGFQEDARLCVSAVELQLQKMTGWLERDRPGFWKREIENCYRELNEARVRLHRCQMRRVGDFRPTCYEERKALEKAKRDLDFAQKQIPVVKFWNVNAQHEANEYHGRASQLTQILERDLPQLLAMLNHIIDRLEAYGNVQLPDTAVAADFGHLPDAAAEPEGSDANTEAASNTADPVSPMDPVPPETDSSGEEQTT